MSINMNYLQALEKAIKEQYGELATMNPKYFWDEEKEKQYIEEAKKVTKNEYLSQDSKEKIELDGIMITKKLLNNKENKNCNTCKVYSFNRRDDVYMNKFGVCYRCYLCNEDK